jgi:enamine deaminase RidA (YjgF/YER057c/UK114 family)
LTFDTLSKEVVMTQTMRRLHALGVELPEPWRLPDGVRRTFEIVRLHDGIGYVAGHGPVSGTEVLMRGRVGDDLTAEDGYESARLTALAITASLERAVGMLDSIRWLRATVYVNGVPELGGPELTRVSDGFSDVINDIFGERGQHARATCAVGALAFGVPTIIESVVAV